MSDEQAVRKLIERWAEAVHAGELEVVLEDHADDIVMFDVPPPYSGVRGLAAYRETWPSFFEWQLVTHEHHSFPSEDSPTAATEVRDLHAHWSDRTAAKDLDALMAGIAEDVVSYEHAGQMQYVGKDAVRAVCAAGLAAADSVSFETPDLRVETRGDLAVSWGLDHVQAGSVDSWSRATRVFQRQDTGWKLIHQHLSFPSN